MPKIFKAKRAALEVKRYDLSDRIGEISSEIQRLEHWSTLNGKTVAEAEQNVEKPEERMAMLQTKGNAGKGESGEKSFEMSQVEKRECRA